jgi:hypothetical protein
VECGRKLKQHGERFAPESAGTDTGSIPRKPFFRNFPDNQKGMRMKVPSEFKTKLIRYFIDALICIGLIVVCAAVLVWL